MRQVEGKAKSARMSAPFALGSLGRDHLKQCPHNNLGWKCCSQREIFGQDSLYYLVLSSLSAFPLPLPPWDFWEFSWWTWQRHYTMTFKEGEGDSGARPWKVGTTSEGWDEALVRKYLLTKPRDNTALCGMQPHNVQGKTYFHESSQPALIDHIKTGDLTASQNHKGI